MIGVRALRPGGAGRVLAVALGLVLAGPVLSSCAAGSAPAASAPAASAQPPPTTTTPAPAGGGTTSTGGTTPAEQAAVADGATAADTDAAGIEWLCRPRQAADPCLSDLTATVVVRSGPVRTVRTVPAAHPAIDCFYVYPTVSPQSTVLADLAIDPAETAVAHAQASRFSSVCRVYAPVYPQLTLSAIDHPGSLTLAALQTAYRGVESAWTDYLQRYNAGRGVVVIGHSQGAAMLIGLLRRQVDGVPGVRRRLVSAIVLGGNVTVPVGRTVGGSFQHIPACTSADQTGCVVAYSSFDQAPPPGSLFGRPGLGVSLQDPTPIAPVGGLEVLCVNPASPPGGDATLSPYFPTAGLGSAGAGGGSSATAWVTQPDLYRAGCRYQDGASWLQVSAPITVGDPRRVVTQSLGPAWGLHLVDVNIALGNLVSLVGRQAAAYGRRAPG